MLRQVLDSLVRFSFEQDDLMNSFKRIDYGNPFFGKKLNIQNDLKKNFQHIDDSLFALSLRQPLISGKINESLTNVEYNINKSLERLAENHLPYGISSQQYTITGANNLAVLLSDLLNNMQSQMGMGVGLGKGKGQGQGQGEGFQLGDIIQKQESLNDKMKEGMKKGSQKGKEEGEEGNGKGEGEGNNGKSGNQNGDNGNGNGDNEDLNGELYEIYKQQQMLRQQLQDRLSKLGKKGNAGNLLRQMEDIEQQLLDKGFNQRTLEKMLNLKYELLKLDEANFEQGNETRRESKTNRTNYENSLRIKPEDIKNIFDNISNKPKRLDALVNNAAIQICKSIDKTSLEDWDNTINTNLRSVFLTTTYELPLLIKRKVSIVNIS